MSLYKKAYTNETNFASEGQTWESWIIETRKGKFSNQNKATFTVKYRVKKRQNNTLKEAKSLKVAAAILRDENKKTATFPQNTNGFAVGVRDPVGRPHCGFAPDPSGAREPRSFSNISSFNHMRLNSPGVVIGFDTEFVQVGGKERRILSYQCVCLDPLDSSLLHEFVFLCDSGDRLPFEDMCRVVIEKAELWNCSFSSPEFVNGGLSVLQARVWRSHKKSGTTKVFKDLDSAISYSDFEDEKAGLRSSVDSRDKARVNYAVRRGSSNDLKQGIGCGYEISQKRLFKHALPVTLVCHTAKADITAFLEDSDCLDLRSVCSEISGGLASLRPHRLLVSSSRATLGYRYVYPLKISVRDTLCHSPAGHKKLSDLGNQVGITKLDILDDYKDRMDVALRDRFEEFLEYGVRDCEVVLEYCAALWGENNSFPVSLPAASAQAGLVSIKDCLGTESVSAFRIAYSGLRKIKKGIVEMGEDNKGWYFERGYEPANDEARTVLNMSSEAYHGGYNACFEIGWVGEETYDFDLENAYPTAMALVEDLDFLSSDSVIVSTFRNEELSLDVIGNFINSFVGYCRFEFPPDVKFPTLPVSVDGSILYPRQFAPLDDNGAPTREGVYVCGPEVFLGLKLGARVFCLNGLIARRKIVGVDEDASPVFSKSLRHAVKQLIEDRRSAQELFGKGSLPDLMLKIAVNSLYGKTAQDVAPHNTWSAATQSMEEVGGSSITSAYHAAMTTSIVRAVLLATLNQLHYRGYKVYSVTTDGFITNAPEEVVTELGLYGLRPILEESREFLTNGDRTIWSIKHRNGFEDTPVGDKGFLNWTTRGNTSLEPTGVNAHGGLRYPEELEEDSLEERLWTLKTVVSRTGAVYNPVKQFAGFREMSKGSRDDRKDFYVYTRDREMRPNFDLKRKPIVSSFTADMVNVDGETYEVAHFDTEPWNTIEEFRRGRELKRTIDCLRTLNEWQSFMLRYDNSADTGRRFSDFGWETLKTLIKGWREGLWSIPALDKCKSRKELVEWVNAWNLTEKKLSIESYKSIIRSDRSGGMLDLEKYPQVLETLKKWQSETVDVTPEKEN